MYPFKNTCAWKLFLLLWLLFFAITGLSVLKENVKKIVMYFVDCQASIRCEIIGRHKALLYLLHSLLCNLILKTAEKTNWLLWLHFHHSSLISSPSSLCIANGLEQLCTNKAAHKIFNEHLTQPLFIRSLFTSQ